MGAPVKARSRLAAWLGPLVFAGAVTLSAALTWRLRASGQFIDETDVPVFGRLLAQGRVLHGDLFSHHTHLEPLAAWVVAEVAPGAGLGAFRAVVWALQLVASLCLVGSALFQRRGTGWLVGALYLTLATLVGALWYGHMILAYNLWGALCAASLALYFGPLFAGREPGPWRSGLSGVLSSLWVMGTPFTVYPVAALLGLAAFAWPWLPRLALTRFAAGLGLGLGLQLVWLLGHADIANLWQQSIVFNAKIFAPYSGEPSGLGGRLAFMAGDLKGLLLQGRTLERVFAASALLTAWALWQRGSLSSSRWRALGAAACVLLFFACLRLRGGHWRAMPFVFACLLCACALFGLALERGWRKRALAVFAILVITAGTAAREGASLYGQDSFQGDPALDLARVWDRELPKDETVLVVPARSAIYLLARRAPGMDAVYYYPWIVEWERRGGRGPHGSFCEQVGYYQPRYILLDRSAMVWSLRWADYQPACLDQFLSRGYKRRRFEGEQELWERVDMARGER